MQKEHQVPIWYFIGWLIAIYGVLIAGYGLIGWGNPPPQSMPPEIRALHADVWWGAFMAILGVFYIVKFPPRAGEGGIDKLE